MKKNKKFEEMLKNIPLDIKMETAIHMELLLLAQPVRRDITEKEEEKLCKWAKELTGIVFEVLQEEPEVKLPLTKKEKEKLKPGRTIHEELPKNTVKYRISDKYDLEEMLKKVNKDNVQKEI